MKIVRKFSHEKQSETIPASGAVNESDHRYDSESAPDAHDRAPVSPVPTFRNRVGGLGHLTLVILFLISGLYAAKRDLSSFTLNALFLMLIGGYDWMQPTLQRNARTTARPVLHTETDRDDSCKSPEPSRLSSFGSELQYRDNDSNLLDEHILRPERPVTPADDVSGAEDCEDDQHPPLLEIDPDIFAADFRHGSKPKYHMDDRAFTMLQSRLFDSYSVRKEPHDPYQPSLFAHSSSLPKYTTPAGFRSVASPFREPHRMNVDERIDQDSDETGSALSKDENDTSNGAFGLKDLPKSAVVNYSFLLGRVVPKACIPDYSTIMAKPREDTITEIDPTTADKPSRKKERRAKRQRIRRKVESIRKRGVGAANLKKGEELTRYMFKSGWVPGDIDGLKIALGLLLEAREETYEELASEGFTPHGWRLYKFMSRWEREPGAMNQKEEERIQRLIKGSWLEDSVIT